MSATPLRILIVAEHASRQFGGEAALPFQYYTQLRRRGQPVWMLTHARVRKELASDPLADQVFYVEDHLVHRVLWRLGSFMPSRIDNFTTGFLSRVLTQVIQRRMARKLVRQLNIDVVHQPIPVSPKEPSLLYGLGAPVVIGPMNGGMDFPPGFETSDAAASRLLINVVRRLSHGMNLLMPGKRKAALLLVANQRTRDALPLGHSPRVVELVENGVELALWQLADRQVAPADRPTRYVFMGRLVDVKRVDLLLQAFAQASKQQAMSLLVIGDGPLLPQLKQQAQALGIESSTGISEGMVHFAGWMHQSEAARQMTEQDCLILPSVRECGGAVVLEAMAVGLPVIAVKWGGPADYLDDSCGILIPPVNATQLANALENAMVELAQDPALRARLGKAGRAKVEREFCWDKKIDTMLGLLESTTTPANPGSPSIR